MSTKLKEKYILVYTHDNGSLSYATGMEIKNCITEFEQCANLFGSRKKAKEYAKTFYTMLEMKVNKVYV